MLRRTGIVAVVLFAALVFLVVACGEPPPTAELTSSELVERVSERTPYDTVDCEDVLKKYASYRNIYQGHEMTPELENNVYTMFSGWLDRDDPPTREQVDDLLAHCRAQGQ